MPDDLLRQALGETSTELLMFGFRVACHPRLGWRKGKGMIDLGSKTSGVRVGSKALG